MGWTLVNKGWKVGFDKGGPFRPPHLLVLSVSFSQLYHVSYFQASSKLSLEWWQRKLDKVASDKLGNSQKTDYDRWITDL